MQPCSIALKNEIISRIKTIIIHELEYCQKIAEQNIKANGRFLVQGLIDFVNE